MQSLGDLRLRLRPLLLSGMFLGQGDKNVSTVLSEQFAQRERSLHPHPDLDFHAVEESADDDVEATEAAIKQANERSKNFRYGKAHDIYSLDIILLEIGLWCPIKDLSRKEQSLEEFRDGLRG